MLTHKTYVLVPGLLTVSLQSCTCICTRFLLMLGVRVYMQKIGEFLGVMGIDVNVKNIQDIFRKHIVSQLLLSTTDLCRCLPSIIRVVQQAMGS